MQSLFMHLQVDFCESNPCQNNASCYATVGNYTCACTAGWKGYHCTTEVDACESSPCQNGGTCSKKPKAEYECTCTNEYEGAQCSTKKNPCDPNPCQNSGTCTQLTYDTYNCTCVYGWDGVNCSSYLGEASLSAWLCVCFHILIIKVFVKCNFFH